MVQYLLYVFYYIQNEWYYKRNKRKYTNLKRKEMTHMLKMISEFLSEYYGEFAHREAK